MLHRTSAIWMAGLLARAHPVRPRRLQSDESTAAAERSEPGHRAALDQELSGSVAIASQHGACSGALSFLGAKLPADAADISWEGTQLTSIWMPRELRKARSRPGGSCCRFSGLSDEYRKMGAIDIGRFVFLSLCSSYQYYAPHGCQPHLRAVSRPARIRAPASGHCRVRRGPRQSPDRSRQGRGYQLRGLCSL